MTSFFIVSITKGLRGCDPEGEWRAHGSPYSSCSTTSGKDATSCTTPYSVVVSPTVVNPSEESKGIMTGVNEEGITDNKELNNDPKSDPVDSSIGVDTRPDSGNTNTGIGGNSTGTGVDETEKCRLADDNDVDDFIR